LGAAAKEGNKLNVPSETVKKQSDSRNNFTFFSLNLVLFILSPKLYILTNVDC